LHLFERIVVRGYHPLGIEANTGICRGMLKHRYAESGAGEEELG